MTTVCQNGFAVFVECAYGYTGVRIKRLAELPALESRKASLFTGQESCATLEISPGFILVWGMANPKP